MIFHRARREGPNLPNLPNLPSLAYLSLLCTSNLLCRVTEYLTLPNLQSSYIPTYLLYAGTSRKSIIQSSTPSLPSSLPPGCRLGIYVCVCTYVSVRPCISVYLPAYLSVCMYIHTYSTHKRYPQKVHIKDTCTRVSWGMWLFLILKIIFADPIDTKKPPDERPCTRPVFHNFTR